MEINGWSYEHEIGIIAVEGWGNPFLVVTENKFWNGESWGYNYYKLGIDFTDEVAAKEFSSRLNAELNISGKRLNSKDSEDFLLSLQTRFPNAQIAA